MTPRVLLFDLETSLQSALIFDPKTEYVSFENLLTERHIISCAWQWHPSRTVYVASLADDPARFARDPHDDSALVARFAEAWNAADACVAHYGDGFDARYLRTRVAAHGYRPLKPIAQIDTWKMAKRGRYNSNRLDYLSKLFGGPRKAAAPHAWWRSAFLGDIGAVRRIARYNAQDIRVLRHVYDRLAPHAPESFHRGIYADRPACPSCGSAHMTRASGARITRNGAYVRWQCQDCGAWARGSKRIAKQETTT